MFQSPQNKVVIKVVNKHIKAVTNVQRLAALQNGTTIDPANFVTIHGEVVSIPKTIKGWEYAGFTTNNIYEGDEAFFSYRVIYDTDFNVDTQVVKYRNLVTYKGEEYFLADIKEIFGVIRGGDIYMVNGWVMLEEYPTSIILLQQQSKKVKGTTSSKIMHIGDPLEGKKAIEATEGDEVLFSPFKPQHYHIGKKTFIILKQNQILGKK